LADKFNWHQGGWKIIDSLNENMGSVGYAAVGVFIVFWGISALNYRWKGYDKLGTE